MNRLSSTYTFKNSQGPNFLKHLTKLEKGKYSHRISDINKRHNSAVKLLPSSVVTTENSCWTVRSERNGSLIYTVKLIKEVCQCSGVGSK